MAELVAARSVGSRHLNWSGVWKATAAGLSSTASAAVEKPRASTAAVTVAPSSRRRAIVSSLFHVADIDDIGFVKHGSEAMAAMEERSPARGFTFVMGGRRGRLWRVLF